MIETIQGPDHPDVVVGLNNLASLYFSQRAFDKAEPLWQRGLSISEQFLGDTHPHLIQTLLTLDSLRKCKRNLIVRSPTIFAPLKSVNGPWATTIPASFPSMNDMRHSCAKPVVTRKHGKSIDRRKPFEPQINAPPLLSKLGAH